MNYPFVTLKKFEEKRVLSGHLWIYSNEIDTQKSPLKNFKAGELIIIQSASGKALGIGYINPHALLCARLLTRDISQEINHKFFIHKIQHALLWREKLFATPFYRLIFGESDGLPGLVIDRFGDTLVIQIATAGMENLKTLIIMACVELLNPKAIIIRNDGGARQAENLPSYVEIANSDSCLAIQAVESRVADEKTERNSVFVGTKPCSAPSPLSANMASCYAHEDPNLSVMLIENNTQFEIPVLQGQKTGWFYDHGESRHEFIKYIKNQRVLDLFSYIGSFGVQAAVNDAESVLCVDSSEKALRHLEHLAKLNHVANKISILCKDIFEWKPAFSAHEKFDVINLDPPALIKRKKDIPQGMRAYEKLQKLALSLLKPNGILFAASCSMHCSSEMLLDALQRAAISFNREIRILRPLYQAKDHPIHPAIPETNYLKGFIIIAN